ncbi:hypothetical protein EYM_03130 [Ignicoccus islandicus DSM 13165]|uniref:Sirohydrochlorin cobaltochelatase n=1 Tax=Ignicoccus islandicus DSM 13165 TaxID=940295 RepID=A0A0U3ED93_9CREN|nr:CbiX/SirB N-terminal domain-containing protein [Ignicoccus islandicus]ALU12387.1 hypothetical protein EYM_03130 [Ignicoccus islandicus DSM 13165]
MKILTVLLLVAHGSKNEKFNEMVLRVAMQLKRKAGKVYVGFLLGTPSVREAAEKAFAESDEVIVVPFFIAEGSHVVKDLKKEIEEVAKGSGKKVVFAKALGDHPLVVEALYQRFVEALRSSITS